MPLKSSLTFFSVLLVARTGLCQARKSMMKSWVKREAYDLSNNQKIEDTLYTRYSFLKNSVFICFYPGWNDHEQPWNLSGDQLTIGITTYTVENLTDSTLTISIPGFRRIILDDENCLNRKDDPEVVDSLDGEPVYGATKYVSPRYEKDEFRKTIAQNLEGYNIRHAITFAASFIVRKDGSVDKVKVISGISNGFDAEVCKQLKKTSKKWKPAFYKGAPVQARMIYTIKYLDSLVN